MPRAGAQGSGLLRVTGCPVSLGLLSRNPQRSLMALVLSETGGRGP